MEGSQLFGNRMIIHGKGKFIGFKKGILRNAWEKKRKKIMREVEKQYIVLWRDKKQFLHLGIILFAIKMTLLGKCTHNP